MDSALNVMGVMFGRSLDLGLRISDFFWEEYTHARGCLFGVGLLRRAGIG